MCSRRISPVIALAAASIEAYGSAGFAGAAGAAAAPAAGAAGSGACALDGEWLHAAATVETRTRRRYMGLLAAKLWSQGTSCRRQYRPLTADSDHFLAASTWSRPRRQCTRNQPTPA